MFILHLISWLLLLVISKNFTNAASQQTARFGCLNGQDDFVNWWFIYKQSDGLSYVYLDNTLDSPIPVSFGAKKEAFFTLLCSCPI